MSELPDTEMRGLLKELSKNERNKISTDKIEVEMYREIDGKWIKMSLTTVRFLQALFPETYNMPIRYTDSDGVVRTLKYKEYIVIKKI
jgi:hypothetical protein